MDTLTMILVVLAAAVIGFAFYYISSQKKKPAKIETPQEAAPQENTEQK